MKLVSYLVFFRVPSRPVFTSSSSSYLNPPGLSETNKQKNQLCLPLQISSSPFFFVREPHWFCSYFCLGVSRLFAPFSSNHICLSFCVEVRKEKFFGVLHVPDKRRIQTNQGPESMMMCACAVFKRSHLDISCCTWRVNISRPHHIIGQYEDKFFFLCSCLFSNYSSLTGPLSPTVV